MSFRHSQKFFEEFATNQTLQAEDSNSETKMFIKKIEIIIFTFVIFIGLVGNTLNLIVFGKKSMRKISTFKFLFYKSAIDILVLLFGATDIVVKNTLDFQIRINSNFLCKVHTFFTYFVTHASSFILMAVSIDRVIIMMNSNSLKTHFGSSNTNRFRHHNYLLDNSVETFRMNEIKEPLTNTAQCESKKKVTRAMSKIPSKKKKASIKININSHSKIVIERVSFEEIKEKFWKREKEIATNEDDDDDENKRDHISMEKQVTESNIKSNSCNQCTLACVFDRFSVNRVVIIILILLILTNIHYILFLKLNAETDNNKLVIDNINEKFGAFKMSHNNTLSLASLTSRQMKSFFNLTAQKIINSNLLDTPTCYAQEDSYHEFFLQKIWIWIDLSVYSLIPFTINMLCSLFIIFKVRKLNRNYSQFLKNKDYEYNKKTYEKKIKKNNQICLMLLMVNLYFFISMLQFWIFFYFFKDTKDQIDDRVYLYVYLQLYTNNAVDFIIYSLSSERYREEALEFFFFFKPKQQTSV